MKKIKQKIKLLVVDDHPPIRAGIISMLANERKKDFDIAEAATGKEAIDKAVKHKFDIVLMDFQLPDMDGGKATKSILEYQPEVKVLAFSNYDEIAIVKHMLKSGANGYMLKNFDGAELCHGIENCLMGNTYFSSTIAAKLITAENVTNTYNLISSLTKRERAVFDLIRLEYTSKDIANKLIISLETVRGHRKNLFKKLQVKNIAGLMNISFKTDFFFGDKN